MHGYEKNDFMMKKHTRKKYFFGKMKFQRKPKKFFKIAETLRRGIKNFFPKSFKNSIDKNQKLLY